MHVSGALAADAGGDGGGVKAGARRRAVSGHDAGDDLVAVVGEEEIEAVVATGEQCDAVTPRFDRARGKKAKQRLPT